MYEYSMQNKCIGLCRNLIQHICTLAHYEQEKQYHIGVKQKKSPRNYILHCSEIRQSEMIWLLGNRMTIMQNIF